MIYRYKATIPQHKLFVRIYEARANSTLYTFHLFLQNDLSFSPDQQVFFCSVDPQGKVVHEYGLFDTGSGSMDQVHLEMLHQQGVDQIRYVFDIFNGRYLDIEFEGIEEELPRKTYPRTLTERGGAPDQFREEHSGLELNFEEMESVGANETS